VAAPGPLFWPHLVYSGMVMWGSLVLDPLHRVVDANPPAERLLGLPVADAIGRPLAELLPEAAEAVRNPGTGGNGLPEELVLTREGATRRYEPTVVAMTDREGPPIGWLVVLRDVTELDEQRRSLLERVVTSQEQERRQVAGDIHDDAIQAMVAVSLQLQALGGRRRDPRSTELLARLGGHRDRERRAAPPARVRAAPAPVDRAGEGDREACGDAGVRGRIPCLSGRSSRRRGPGRCR
jgi:PAS domain S-box-containing protein